MVLDARPLQGQPVSTASPKPGPLTSTFQPGWHSGPTAACSRCHCHRHPVHSQGQSLLSVDPAQPALGIRFRAQCPAQSVGGCWSQPGDRGGWETEAWGRKSEGQDQGVNPRKGGVWTPCTAMGSHGRWWRKVILPPGSLRGACWPVLKPQSCPLSQLGPPHFPCREQGPLALVGSQLQGKCLMLKQPHSMFPAASGLELEIDPTMTPTPAPKATI